MIITDDNIDSIDLEKLTPEQRWQVEWHRKQMNDRKQNG